MYLTFSERNNLMLLGTILECFEDLLCKKVSWHSLIDILLVLFWACGKTEFPKQDQGLSWAAMLIPLFRQIFRSSSKCVCFSILGTRVKDNFEVILCKFLGPPGLPSIKKCLSNEVLEVMVICDYREGLRKLMQVHMPLVEYLDNGEELFVTDSIITLSWEHLFWYEGSEI